MSLEDVSMSFWVELAKTKYGLPVKIVNSDDIRYLTGACGRESLVVHYVSPAAQRCAWETVSQAGYLSSLISAPDFCSCQSDGIPYIPNIANQHWPDSQN